MGVALNKFVFLLIGCAVGTPALGAQRSAVWRRSAAALRNSPLVDACMTLKLQLTNQPYR